MVNTAKITEINGSGVIVKNKKYAYSGDVVMTFKKDLFASEELQNLLIDKDGFKSIKTKDEIKPMNIKELQKVVDYIAKYYKINTTINPEKPMKKIFSYTFKHKLEGAELDYVGNGTAMAALLINGFKIAEIQNINAYFEMPEN